LYQEIVVLDFINGLKLFLISLGPVDLGWFLVYFSLSRLTDDLNIAQAIVSALLFWHCTKFFAIRCSKAKLYLLFFNFFINIQFLALSFSSLRLTVAFLLFFIASNSGSLLKYLYMAAAVVSHVTISVVILLSRTARLTLGHWLALSLISLFVIFLSWSFVGTFLLGKLNSYSGGIGIKLNVQDLIKLVLILTLLYFGTAGKSFFYVLPIIPIFLIIPDPRIYQLAYFVVYIRLTLHRSQNSLLALVVLSLLGVPNGIDYVQGVFERGNGLHPDNFE
jgi:hypothetical protein